MLKDKLGEYSAKRKFEATPEPGPVPVEGRRGPLMFVIQQHSATRLHYDLRLECDGVLMSWAVPKGPSLDPAEKRLAVRTENHPFDYGSFEGVIPPGQYGAGEVIVWDCGVYSPDEDQEYWFHDREEAERRVREGMEKGKLGILLRGEKVKGSFALVRTKDVKNWLLIKHKDRFAAKVDLTAQSRSVLSGVTVADLTLVPVQRLPAALLTASGDKRPFPDKLSPMHAELGDKVFNSADWMWEPKLDGYRALALIDEHGVKLRSRRGLELGGDFPRLADELGKQLIESMVLDGEIVAFDASGKPSFGAMQNRGSTTERAVFYCFDLLYFAGVDLRRARYTDRRRYLAQCLLPSPLVQLVHAVEDGVALHEAAMSTGLEGVIGKRKDSRYEAGKRSTSWLKVKPTNSAEFVIGGYTKGKGARAPLGALLLGYWEGSRLRCASHVGSGFDDPALKQPALTKRDLLRYFAQVSSFILPHLEDRPLTMIRMPDGIHGQRFFQKHWEQERPDFVQTITVFSAHKDEQHAYLLCNNLPTLLWLAQSGTLEFHVWHSRAKPGPDTAGKGTDYASSLAALEGSVLNYPDYVVFDIDPYIYSGKEAAGAEPELNTVAFEKGKEVAFWLRELLQSMSLEAVVKTSGKTGLHVFVPIERTIDFDAARKVSEMVGRHLVRLRPKDVTVEWSVPKRTGKIFMDYNMNVRGKTLNVAYSPRGAPGAPVSMPLTWEELAEAHPLDFRLTNAAERLAQTGDRWRDALTRKQSLDKVLERAKA